MSSQTSLENWVYVKEESGEPAAGRDGTTSVGRRVAMASIRKEIFTTARAHKVWDAIRDVGALHTRLVPGFVVDTRLEEGARVVTFGNGVTVREPIVDIDDRSRRRITTLTNSREVTIIPIPRRVISHEVHLTTK